MFWIVTGAVAVVVAVGLAVALVRGQRATGPAEAFDIEVYRDQLKEIESETARGKIAPDEAERLKVEISRRLLAADAKAQGGGDAVVQPEGVSYATAALVGAGLLAGTFGLYMAVGAPGYSDMPREARIAQARSLLEERPSQAEIEAQLPAVPPVSAPEEYAQLVVRLREAVAERPDDLQGQMLLARSEAALGNFAAAYEAQARVVALKGDEAAASDHADLADMMVLAAGGYVSPEAQAALEKALELDPRNGAARYYGGLMMVQTGRPDIGFAIWSRLLSESAPDAPWVPPIREQIMEVARAAGETRYQLPEEGAAPVAPLPGPSQADIAAAQEMTLEERQQMIRGMVEGLSARLATEGGSPDEWARLIGALGVLDEPARAAAIWTEAQMVFAGNVDALEVIREAARRAGVAE